MKDQIIFPCGHSTRMVEEGETIILKDISLIGKKVAYYKRVCMNCYEGYEIQDRILYSDKEADKWVKSDEIPDW